jgi:oligoribonuclease
VASVKVSARITGVRVGRHRQIGIEANERDLEHGPPYRPVRTPAPADGAVMIRRYHAQVLVWMDLEMTGLDPARNAIVEIATLVTDDELEVVAEGPDLVVQTTAEHLAAMEDVVREMHARSGLLTAIKSSTLSLEEAGRRTLDFIKTHVPEQGTVPLCGNSIGTDRRFLAAQLPDIENWLHYRSVDVSTVKELCRRWYPKDLTKAPGKKMKHRALDDVRDSVAELAYYRAVIFAPPPADTASSPAAPPGNEAAVPESSPG